MAIRCNNCDSIYQYESDLAFIHTEDTIVVGCSTCQTDEYLMDVDNETRIFSAGPDEHLDLGQCWIISGSGAIHEGYLIIDTHFYDQWTAWYIDLPETIEVKTITARQSHGIVTIERFINGVSRDARTFNSHNQFEQQQAVGYYNGLYRSGYHGDFDSNNLINMIEV